MLSRITGLGRDLVIGWAFGTGAAADAFFVAFRIPNLLRRFVAEGAMGMAFVPVLTEYLTRHSRAEAVVAARTLAATMMVLLGALVVVGVVFAPAWVTLFAPGFLLDAEKTALTVELTRLMFPYVFLIGMVALLAGLLNALRHFAAPASSPVLLNLAVIAAALLLAPRLASPIHGLAYGVLIGGGLQLTVQAVALERLRVPLRPLWRPSHPVLPRVGRLLLPALIGAAVYQVNILVGTILASVLPPGSVSYLWYADRVFELPLGLVAVALGTAALPSFAAQASRNALGELRESVLATVRVTSSIALGASAGLLVLAVPITVVLFHRGAFGLPEAERTARALQAFAVGLWPVAVARLLVPAFYALGDTRTPVIAAACSLVANLLFSLALMGSVEVSEGSSVRAVLASVTETIGVWDLGHAGLALATSLSAAVNVLVLLVALRRRLSGMHVAPLMASAGRGLLAGLMMIVPVHLVASSIAWPSAAGAWLEAAVLFGAICAGVAAFALAVWILGGPERELFRRLLREARGGTRM